MKHRIVILGGGSGGVLVANRLVRALHSGRYKDQTAEVLVIGDQEQHFYQPGLLYIALGLSQPKDFLRPQREVLLPGVKFRFASVQKIDLENRRLILDGGEDEAFDYLVIATGSHPDLDDVPGFREGAYSFYTLPEALRLQSALRTFDGGKLLMIIGIPHKCPVAPLEFLLMYEDMLRQSGRRDNIQIQYTYPIGRVHALEFVAEWAARIFEERGIAAETFFNLETVNPQQRTVQTLEGDEVGYDLLVGIPPHKGARVIRNSGLGDADGWLPTDRHTLQLKGESGVYVIGDAADLPISKAGSTAHYEADTVVQNLLLELSGEPPTAFYNGKVACFIESSLDEATYIAFDYLHPPVPTPPATTVHWFKLAFNQMYWATLRGLV